MVVDTHYTRHKRDRTNFHLQLTYKLLSFKYDSNILRLSPFSIKPLIHRSHFNCPLNF